MTLIATPSNAESLELTCPEESLEQLNLFSKVFGIPQSEMVTISVKGHLLAIERTDDLLTSKEKEESIELIRTGFGVLELQNLFAEEVNKQISHIGKH